MESRLFDRAGSHCPQIVITIVAMLQYSRSSANSKFQKMISIYLKSAGVPAKVVDLLHSFGLAMSYKWAEEAVRTLSAEALKQIAEDVKNFSFVTIYDNLNIARKVYSQRVDHQSAFENGTAATIITLPTLKTTSNIKYKSQRRRGAKIPLTVADLIQTRDVLARMHSQSVHHCLTILLQSTPFESYRFRTSAELIGPPPVKELPTTKARVHMLRTMKIDESTYEGNKQVLAEIWNQIGLGDETGRKEMGYNRVIPIAADGLTIARLHGLYRFLCEDLNSFERMENILPVFGLFHLKIIIATSLHKQYLGTPTGFGLRRDFHLLDKKGLLNPQTKGDFFWDLNEALNHILEAHILDCWLQVSGSTDLSQLLAKTPAELKSLSRDLVQNYASTQALELHDSQPAEQQDAVYRQNCMFLRDALVYRELAVSNKVGDVGRFEDLIPTLTLRCAGGGHGNYQKLFLELLQGFKHEWGSETAYVESSITIT